MAPGALDGVLILDLTSEMGWYCGKLLADLGADVIKVEPVGGDPSRGRAPYWNGTPGRETSLRFWYFNANKRSVTADLGQYDGRWLFGELVKTADIVVESWTAAERAELAEHGVDPEAYMDAQPALVWVSITGFGLDGPRAGWQVTDLIAQAASGIATLAGYPDGSPMRIAGNQAYIVGGISAAQGALLALLQAETTGEGQRVETSMQEALSICQETAHLQWDFQHTSRERMGEQHRMPGIGTYQTQDGYIYSAVGIPGFGAPWSELIRWMDDEGRAEELTEPEYAETFASFNMRDLALGSTLDDLGPVMSRAQEVLTAFYASKASLEVYEQGQARRLLIGMVASPADIGDDEHLNTREWWLEFDQPTRLGSDDAQVRMPGPPYRLSDTPTSIRRPAPQIGEHNQEVWVDEVGIPAEDLIAFAGEGAI
ncbi:MAG: CoA transferase [Chloroflexi bacterium]|nr:CoA transferase [Chloroflexota bacterium]